MKKKIISLLISSIIFNSLGFVSLQTVAKAKVNTNDKRSVSTSNNKLNRVLDITGNPNYEVESGQVKLSDFNVLSSDQNTLRIEPKSKSISKKDEVNANKLNEQFKQSKALRKFIEDRIKNGAKISAIGYTEATVEKNSLGQIVPVTKGQQLKELIAADSAMTGSPSAKGKLVLTTSAETMIYDNQKYVVGYTLAGWSGWDTDNPITGENGPATGADYISITVPNRYILSSRDFWNQFPAGANVSGYVDNWCTNDTEHAIVYAFNEIKQINSRYNTYASDIKIDSVGKSSDTSTQNEKFISHYVHTYKSISITPTVGVTGDVTFQPSVSDASWQLSSSVTDNF